MSDDFARAWIEGFVERLRGTEVTDADGGRLDLEDGSRRAAQRIVAVAPANRKVLLFGNGGSAAIVSHVHADLCKAVGVRALVFHETPLLTAITNDDGYPRVFEQPVATWAEAGDLCIAVSSSGRSENVLCGARAALARGVELLTFTGFDAENPLRAMGSLNFWVASRGYGIVEGVHVALLHHLTDRACALRGATTRDG